MSNITAVVDKYFTVASETYENNLSGSIGALAVTVPVNSANAYADGDNVVLTVEPGTSNEATFVGTKASSPDRFVNCQWTEGNLGVGHASGVTIVDYDSSTHHNLQTKGIRQFANDNGTLKTQPVRDALGLVDAAANGWEVVPAAVAVTSGYNAGNRRVTLNVANYDVRNLLTRGNPFKMTPTYTAPTQCADFESSSSQYASRASGSLTGGLSTATDDITVETWIKPESISGYGIMSRYDGTNGWIVYTNANGQIVADARAGGVFRAVISKQCIKQDRFQHIAVSFDVSANSILIYLNGKLLETTVVGGSGANTTFGAVGPFNLGNYNNGTAYYDGRMQNARVWNVVRTATQIRDNMNSVLVGNETGLIGYWKLDGNFNDSTASANHLTSSGGAIATFADTISTTIAVGVVVDFTYSAPNSTIVLQMAEGYELPNGAITSPYYSTQDSPYGFPDRDRFKLAVWETTPANDVAKYIIEAATDVIPYVNSGSAGGVWWYSQVGTRKEFWGRTNPVGTSNAFVDFPTGFFNAWQSANASAVGGYSNTNVVAGHIEGISTTQANLFNLVIAGSAPSNPVSFHMIGS